MILRHVAHELLFNNLGAFGRRNEAWPSKMAARKSAIMTAGRARQSDVAESAHGSTGLHPNVAVGRGESQPGSRIVSCTIRGWCNG